MQAKDCERSYALSTRPAVARRQLRDFLARERWSGDVDGAVLAVHEALVNAERHAGGARGAAAGLAAEGSLVVDVLDKGPGFAMSSDEPDPPGALGERGRGLWLIRELASSAEVKGDNSGACLRLRFDEP